MEQYGIRGQKILHTISSDIEKLRKGKAIIHLLDVCDSREYIWITRKPELILRLVTSQLS